MSAYLQGELQPDEHVVLLRDARLLAKHVTQQLPEAKMPLVREMVIKHMGGGGGGGGGEPSDDKKKI